MRNTSGARLASRKLRVRWLGMPSCVGLSSRSRTLYPCACSTSTMRACICDSAKHLTFSINRYRGFVSSAGSTSSIRCARLAERGSSMSIFLAVCLLAGREGAFLVGWRGERVADSWDSCCRAGTAG